MIQEHEGRAEAKRDAPTTSERDEANAGAEQSVKRKLKKREPRRPLKRSDTWLKKELAALKVHHDVGDHIVAAYERAPDEVRLQYLRGASLGMAKIREQWIEDSKRNVEMREEEVGRAPHDHAKRAAERRLKDARRSLKKAQDEHRTYRSIVDKLDRLGLPEQFKKEKG